MLNEAIRLPPQLNALNRILARMATAKGTLVPSLCPQRNSCPPCTLHTRTDSHGCDSGVAQADGLCCTWPSFLPCCDPVSSLTVRSVIRGLPVLYVPPGRIHGGTHGRYGVYSELGEQLRRANPCDRKGRPGTSRPIISGRAWVAPRPGARLTCDGRVFCFPQFWLASKLPERKELKEDRRVIWLHCFCEACGSVGHHGGSHGRRRLLVAWWPGRKERETQREKSRQRKTDKGAGDKLAQGTTPVTHFLHLCASYPLKSPPPPDKAMKL
jgi:hypothetical protein